MQTLMKIAVSLSFVFISMQLLAVNEVEPNGSFSTANQTYNDSVTNGTTTSPDDDYFFTVLPDDGTVQVIVNYTNTSGNAGADLALFPYNRNKTNLGTRSYVNIPINGSASDTFYLYCMLKDTVYFRMFSSENFTYSFRYTLLPAATNDTEPNDAFAAAKPMSAGVVQQGRIHYTSGVATDVDDYFFTVLPDDGTLELIYEWTNTSNDGGSDLAIFPYNRNRTNLGTISLANQPIGGPFRDTAYYYCQAQDTVFFRVNASGCFNYSLTYNLLPATTNDPGPNDGFASAKPMTAGATQPGRIGYTSGVATDNDDYFFSVLPTDGVLELIYEWTNTSNSGGSDLAIFPFNRNRTNLGTISLANQPIGGPYRDTAYYYCQSADTVFFRVNASGCFNYNIRYNVLPPAANDVEPNGGFASAKPILASTPLSGHIGHSNGITTDIDDYFFSVLPDDGVMEVIYEWTNTSNSGGSDLAIFPYNRNRGNLGVISLPNQPLGGPYRDTAYYYCQSKDTVFFRINASGCFDYTLQYNLLPAGQPDVEPNNDFALAKFFTSTATQSGRIAHNNGITTDNDDYFVTVLPTEGTVRLIYEWTNTSNDGGSDFAIYPYNRNRTNQGTISQPNQTPGGPYRDTVLYYCQAADTFYFRVNANGCFDYNFRYEMISPTMADLEPNNTRPQAITLSNGSSTEGTIGFGNGITSDVDDYYRIVNPKQGNVLVDYTITTSSGNGGSDFYAYAYRSNGSTVTSNVHANVGSTIRDTLLVQCQAADTFYIRFNSNACFNYTINSVTITNEQPEAVAKFSQLRDKVGFVADTSNATSIIWDLGDGTTSNLAYPRKTYPIGGYTVVLSATKGGCNLTARDTVLLSVNGIEMYEPKQAGAGGDAIFHVYGGGLDTSTTVVIRKGSESYTLIDKSSTSTSDHLAGLFDIHLASSGFYDLEITIQGEPTITYTNGFEITDFNYPYCTAEIVGPNLARRNRDNRYVLKISNSGNVMARSAIIHIAYPATANVNFGTQIMRRDVNASTTISEDTSTYTLPNSDFLFWYDTVSAFVAIDTLQGEPYNGFFGRFYLPFVPANGTIEIPFTANFSSNGNYDMIVFMNYPNRQGSLVTPQLDNFDNVYLANTIDALDLVADNTKNVPLKTVVKTSKVFQKHLNLTARIGFDYMFSKYYGYEISEQQMQSYAKAAGEANEYALLTAAEEGAGYLSNAGARKAREIANTSSDDLFKLLARNKNLSPESQQKILENIRNLNNGADRLESLDKLLNSVRGLKTVDEKRRYIEDYVAGCPELEDALKELLDLNNEELNHKEEKKKPTEVINSTDPNAIYGNIGTGSFRSLRGGETMHYMVMFENVDTATAPAQEIIIYDTINPAYFDLSTFEFGTAYIADKSVRLGNDRKEFFWEIDMNPTMNLIARVYAKLDTSNGAIEWRFISLDPLTGDLPSNPLAGILPPNVNAPQGEGFVTYSVNMRQDVPNNTTIPNTAFIIFDDNAPLQTNTWTNLVDKVAPTSSLSATKVDTIITFNLSGVDNESGMGYYRLYYKTDTTDWAGMATSYSNTFQLVCDPNVTYYFYVEGVDSVGNQERKPEVAEVTIVGIDERMLLAAEVRLFPNPSRGEVYIQTDRTLADLEIELMDLLGRSQLTVDKQTLVAGSLTPLNVSTLSPGIYLVNLRTGSTVITQKLVLTE